MTTAAQPRSSRLLLLALVVGVLAAGALAACGDDVVAYSETVSTKLSGLKPGDIDNGSASVQKNINTESGNPYGAFLSTAKSRLGRDPGAVEPTRITVRVSADSKNVIGLEEVFTDLEVFFADSQTTLPVGTIASPNGSSQVVTIASDLDLEPIADAMLHGDFKVGVRGHTVSPAPADFELKLVLDIAFRALE